MKDKSLLFFFSVFGLFALFGSALFLRVTPESLPERARVALETGGFRGLSVAFDGNRAFLLGEAPSGNDLSQAGEVLGRVEGVASVDVSHATVKRSLESPHMSLAFVGNRISVRGHVSSEETKDQIIKTLEERFPEAKIDADRLVALSEIEDYGGFSEAPTSLTGVGEFERERGVIAAVGGDMVWQVMEPGSGIDEIKAGLAKVLPDAEVAATLDEFDDVLTEWHLFEEQERLKGILEEQETELAAKVDEVKSMEGVLGEARETLEEITGRAQAGEVKLSMTEEMLERRERELAETRSS